MDGQFIEQKKKLVIALVAVATALTLFLGVKILGEIKNYMLIGKDISPQSTITVSGKGEKLVQPDVAEFSFSVTKEAKTVGDAQKEATQVMNKAITIAKGFGVDEKDIRTTGYNIYPKHEYRKSMVPCNEWGCPLGNQVVVGYEVSQSVLIKVRNISDAGGILSKIGEAGVTQVSGLTFLIDEEDKVKGEARATAIEDAQAKANLLAKQLGVKLVRIVNFSESDGYPVYYGKAVALGMGGDTSTPVPEIPTGENAIISNVTITYEIR